MDARKCPFGTPLVTHQFSCPRAQEVVRRGGAEIDCTNPIAHDRCVRTFERLKAAALPAFGVEDDLLSMPHSVVVKIQCGGLLGLHRAVRGAPADRIENIEQLVADSQARIDESVPEAVLADITAYKPRARRR